MLLLSQSIAKNNNKYIFGTSVSDSSHDFFFFLVELIADRSYSLIIDFNGLLSTTEMTGFYKSSYVTYDGTTRYLATTQFQPTSARRAFPCFDEPFFKAFFQIYITYPTGYNALSNTAAEIFTSDEYVCVYIPFNSCNLKQIHKVFQKWRCIILFEGHYSICHLVYFFDFHDQFPPV